jgi:hypothetical protein
MSSNFRETAVQFYIQYAPRRSLNMAILDVCFRPYIHFSKAYTTTRTRGQQLLHSLGTAAACTFLVPRLAFGSSITSCGPSPLELNSSMTASYLPFLPAELEREIFEIAALCNPRSMPSFILVAQRIKAW